ncbi:MAG: hypothetical protein ACQESE_03685 [Nanobdellota archaeon]
MGYSQKTDTDDMRKARSVSIGAFVQPSTEFDELSAYGASLQIPLGDLYTKDWGVSTVMLDLGGYIKPFKVMGLEDFSKETVYQGTIGDSEDPRIVNFQEQSIDHAVYSSVGLEVKDQVANVGFGVDIGYKHITAIQTPVWQYLEADGTVDYEIERETRSVPAQEGYTAAPYLKFGLSLGPDITLSAKYSFYKPFVNDNLDNEFVFGVSYTFGKDKYIAPDNK